MTENDNNPPERRIPLVVILGPTAVGKTALALRLGETLGAEIVSADSRLFYRGMDIGTAKPSLDERQRVPHHLIDVAEIGQTWSLARFQQEAARVIRELDQRRVLPLLVGGTGQYITALLEGWSPPPRSGDPQIRERLEALAEREGAAALHARLAAVDPRRAQAIDARNIRRVVRALEIYELTGQPPSAVRRVKPSPYDVLWIGLNLPRAVLYARIDARIDQMLAAGLLEEVREILAQGVAPQSPALSAIGYRQLIEHLQGESSLEAAVARIRKLTRQFVRRQANWFKPGDERIHWFEPRPGLENELQALIEGWIAGRQA